VTSDDEYELNGPDAAGKGVFTESGFVVKAGSMARREIAPSGRNISTVHQRLLAEGVLQDVGGQLRFARDHVFKSPSGAAAVVLGRTANGWTSWRRADGKTLSEAKRVSRDAQTRLLAETKRAEIIARHRQLLLDGAIKTDEVLDGQYELFRDRFGPAVLKSLDGDPLLTLMHDHRNRDSLVYWLEFKDDEEFGTKSFGSISGGSALKFRLFRRKETGLWQAGSERGNKPQDITKDQAIAIARSHRDQLLKGVELLEAFPDEGTDDEYAELQDQMDELAPDVSGLAWGHKYFSLLFPSKLDDYHSPAYQRFHLLKLLQLPPDGDGRYVCAGRFQATAKEVGLTINHLTTTLNALHGDRHRYWRIGTTAGSTGQSFWPMMRERSIVAIGWSRLGDLSSVADQDGKTITAELKSRLAETYPNHPTTIGQTASQIGQFLKAINDGDVVVAADGMRVLGVGRVTGAYTYEPSSNFPHHRPVEWLVEDEWQMPNPREGLLSTVRELAKDLSNRLAIEDHIQLGERKPPTNPRLPSPQQRLKGIPERIQSILGRKGQAILYGPPGGGKTFWAERTARELASLAAFATSFESLTQSQQRVVVGADDTPGLVRLCCFHPAYGYEDFIEGFRPGTGGSSGNPSLAFMLRDGVFKKLCRDAAAAPERHFYLIVDEINRGDIPRIFGELLTVLEKDKRGKRIILPVSQEAFSVPGNVFLIGTMNTADRSISLLDAALRRRFGFVELMPDGTVLKDQVIAGISLRAWLEALNTRIREHVGRDARNLQIGHSYLMHDGGPIKDIGSLKRAIRDDIIPLLEEYCYEDYGTLSEILGKLIVDPEAARVRHELFEDGQEDSLIQGLLAPCPEIATSTEVLAAEEEDEQDTQPEEDTDEDMQP
jgi:5-methylcytosine-specific restriction protein B